MAYTAPDPPVKGGGAWPTRSPNSAAVLHQAGHNKKAISVCLNDEENEEPQLVANMFQCLQWLMFKTVCSGISVRVSRLTSRMTLAIALQNLIFILYLHAA